MKPNLPKAILLDLDDTILAYGNADGCWRKIYQAASSSIGPFTPSVLLGAILESRDWFWSKPVRNRNGRLDLPWARHQIVKTAFEQLRMDPGELANHIADTFTVEREKIVKPFPGALEALRASQRLKTPMALITNGAREPQWEKINRFGLEPFFNCIVVEGEFGVGKPDTRVYTHALERLNTQPQDTWMVGDHIEFDVGAPQELGIFGVWINPLGAPSPQTSAVEPDRVIRTLSELFSSYQSGSLRRVR